MAVTLGQAGTAGETTSEVAFFQSREAGGSHSPCLTLMVRCTGANPALIHVDGLHDTGVQVVVPVGEREYFRCGETGPGIQRATVQGQGGSTTIDWGPVATMNVTHA